MSMVITERYSFRQRSLACLLLPARDPQKDAEDPVLRMILWVSVRSDCTVFPLHYDVT